MAEGLRRTPIRLKAEAFQARPVGRQRAIPPIVKYDPDYQRRRIGPKFERLAEVLARDSSGAELHVDPSGLAPERLLVFEVRGETQNFANAIQRVPGLELIEEEELAADEDRAPVAYLLMPDLAALKQVEGLWRRWQAGQEMQAGFAPWREVFATLRDLRPWGPNDRVLDSDAQYLVEELEGYLPDERVSLEVELVFRERREIALAAEAMVTKAILAVGREVARVARIESIAYHALLAKMPADAVRGVVERRADGLAGLEPVLYIRPQSIVSSIEVSEVRAAAYEAEPLELGAPILSMLDGVPLAQHQVLSEHLVVDDVFELEQDTVVEDRKHGTAMASLLIHGDRNSNEEVLPRRVHAIPLLGGQDQLPSDQLVVDMVYRAVLSMRGGETPSAPQVLIVNLSLGNARRPFHGQMSAWARLLDRLAYDFGVLFIVSAGNVVTSFEVSPFAGRIEFEAASESARADAVLNAIATLKADRKVISPAESLNALTVGAQNIDAVDPAELGGAAHNIEPYPQYEMANPSSALGPGYGQGIKPDFLMPGGKERLRVLGNEANVMVGPATASRQAGLKVACPPRGIGAFEAYTNGTSAAAALASRTAHRIHDVLEQEYGEEFMQLSHLARATLLKALLVHPARWHSETVEFIKRVIGPQDNRQWMKQRDNVRRFLGYGVVDPEQAIECAADRATFWAIGQLTSDRRCSVKVPLPASYGGKAQPHSISATLAWMTPVGPKFKAYRGVKLTLHEPDTIGELGVEKSKTQPDNNQAGRGTVCSRVWVGEKAAALTQDQRLELKVQREPDRAFAIDDLVTFALAVTLEMPAVNTIFDEAKAMVQPRVAT